MKDCIDIIRQGVGRDMTEEEILGLFEQVKKMRRRVLAGKKAADAAEEVMAAASNWADRLEVEAVAQKRALQLQMAARLKAVDMVLNTFKGREADGISALQVGIQSARAGSRLSVDAMGKGLTGQYLGGVLADLNALGKDRYALFKRGAMDKEVAMALFSIDNPATPFRGPKEALEIAQVMHKWQEKARLDRNRAGAWIGKEPGYIVRQSHDRSKIRRAGFEQWKADILPLLDWDRTADGQFDPEINDTGINDFLKTVYDDISTGVHLKPETRENSLARTGTIGSAAARASRERVLHFQNGEAWFNYNQKYGRGNLREAFTYGLGNAAQSTALMRVFGPSPQANLESIIDDVRQTLRSRADMAGIDRLNNALPRLHNQMKEIDGTLNIEGNPSLALVGRVVRTMESLSKLGGALLSSFSDAPTFASEFAYQGRGFFGSMAQGMAGLLQGRGTVEQQRIMSLCGVFFDSMSGGLGARFAGEELPGKLTALQQLFFRMNGLGWWTDTWKRSATLMMSHDLALEKGLDWNGLTNERRRVLGLYGIDAGRWDIIRAGQTMAADGRDYLTPEAVYDVPDAMLERYLLDQGKQVSPGRVAELRDEIATQLRTYFRDRVDYAVLEPDARTRAILRQGTAAGTGVGEALRFVTQFKSFPTAYLQKVLGREFFGRGAEKWGEALRNEHGEISNFARLFLMMTLFGYGSMTAKQFIAGKTPREPDDPKTWIAAAAQGGGLGIYGDFLFGEKSRMGSSFYSSLAGPALGSAESVYNLYQNIREGKDVTSETFRLFFNHLPGNNLFWFRTAFDHFIGYNLYEMMNPGYIDRMKRRVEKENNQTFWIEPYRW
jgi:hypothetical protein